MRHIVARKRFLLGLIASLSIGASVAAQGPAANTPAFDAVSIKHGETGMLKPCKYFQERVSCETSLLNLIMEAHQLGTYFRLDAPKWTGDNDYIFVLEANMPAGTTVDTARLMLRQALSDRFDLKVRDIAVYALIPGKHDVKLRPANDQGNPRFQ